MITTLQGENISDISNFVFFTEKGYEIPTQKTYTIEWELIPNDAVANNFISNPKGHFMFDITDTSTIYVIVDDKGKIIKRNTTIKAKSNDVTYAASSDSFNQNIVLLNISQSYEKPISKVYNRNLGEYVILNETVYDNIYNTVRITFNTLTESVTKDYPVLYIFSSITSTDKESKDENNETTFTYFTVDSLTLVILDDVSIDNYGGLSLIHVLIKNNFTYESLFPCIRYMGNIMQDKVSTEFIGANTIIILELTDSTTFVRPKFGTTNNYKLYFEFLSNSEMKFISSDSIANIIWNSSFEVSDDINQGTAFDLELQNVRTSDDLTLINARNEAPIYFTVGFLTELEGCYQNIMAMYLVKKSTNTKYLLGMFTFLTEVEGEDERYRALLGNLGIPDPIKYPNIFKSQDPDEQGTDWTLVNNKSKQLMLTYDNIFPYVGTYKALYGAVHFLGYEDLIFKEWYKIKDLNNRDKYVTLQTYDVSNGKSLQTKLKSIGVSFGEFERYRKLNRLTMLYHLNELDDETGEYITFYTKRNDVGNNATTSPENGLYKSINPTTHYANITDTYSYKVNLFMLLPFTKKLYEYRTDEVLAKLYSVKQWLEKYILGVNCYITDICGEGIIVERLKTQSYVTLHHLLDITTIGKFTPKIVYNSSFIDSSAYLKCSLNEFDSLTFNDYEDYAIDRFIKKEIIKDNQTIYVSAPLETLVTADEYLFTLTNKETSSGTLEEFTDSSFISNPLLILDNELLFFDETQNITKIDKSELPIIEIECGNLRLCHGNWKSNIAYSISSTIDLNTGDEYYTMYDEETGNIFYKGFLKVLLQPYVSNTNINKYKLYWVYKEEGEDSLHNVFNGLPSELVYTTHTKWNVPMLIMRNYICTNNDEPIPGDFILEIIEGRILFRNKRSDINSGYANGAELTFTMELEGNEQLINLDYTYISDRVPIYEFDSRKLPASNITLDDITKCVTTNRYVDVSVNRLGTYTVSVNAFDYYNNIYVNKSDDFRTLSAKPIEIDTILNTYQIKNNSDFYDRNFLGKLIPNVSINTLRTNINQYASVPLYPLTYRIYDIDPVLDSSNTIEYDNISYAIDTPRDGNFLVFNNFTERVLNIDKNGNTYTLKLIDENPNIDSILNAEYVGLCIYDSILKNILTDIYPLKVKSLHIIDASIYLYDRNNSYIEVEKTDNTYNGDILDISNSSITLDNLADICHNTSNLNSSSYFINSINAYLYNATELIIYDSSNPDSLLDKIVVDYDNKKTYIYDTTPKYVLDLTVKICYTTDVSIHNQYSSNTIDNETTYRIENINIIDNSSCYYILNGIVDKYKLNNKIYHNKAEHKLEDNKTIGPVKTSKPYKIKLCPSHLRPALYILRISGFGEELTQQYNNGNVMKTLVNYSPTPLLFTDYLDTIYSALIFDYDPKLLQNMWFNALTTFGENTKLYTFRNMPITINKGRSLILMPNNEQITLTNKFNNEYIPLRVNWNWLSYLIDDLSNFNSEYNVIGKQTVFKSINKILTILPELLGTQSPNMVCCDIFGNRLVNEGDGFIYVDETEAEPVNVAVKETREIYYKDVFIVGFKTLFDPPVLASGGESVAISINQTGATSDDNRIINAQYQIYYSDGTIVNNEGASINLLTAKGNVSKTNKVKVKVSESTEPHKYVATSVNALITLNKTNERDLVDPVLIVNIGIQLYGYSLTTSIYNLTFTFNDIPSAGILDMDKFFVKDNITNITYTQTRSGGEVEEIHNDNLYDSFLMITDFKYTDNSFGMTNNISKNNSGRKFVGIIQVTFLYNVIGITDTITTTSFANVYLL